MDKVCRIFSWCGLVPAFGRAVASIRPLIISCSVCLCLVSPQTFLAHSLRNDGLSRLPSNFSQIVEALWQATTRSSMVRLYETLQSHLGMSLLVSRVVTAKAPTALPSVIREQRARPKSYMVSRFRPVVLIRICLSAETTLWRARETSREPISLPGVCLLTLVL
jgi:hypothetical protein